MAYQFTAASSQYLSSSSPLTGNPMTITFLFKTNAVNGCGVSVGKFNVTQRNNVFVLPASGAVVNVGSSDSVGTTASVNSSSTFTNGSWSHAAAVYSSNSSRTAYCNGGGAQTNTSLINSSPGFDSVFIGARFNPSLGGFFSGDLAEIGIWNAALTAAEVASLARGMTCDKVLPQNLVFYAPLVRDLIDAKGGLTITNNNGATISNHPRVYA